MNTRFQNETDVGFLRKVAQVQDAELRRLAKKVVTLMKELAELRGEPLTQQELAGLLEAETIKLKKAAGLPVPKPKKRRKTFGPRQQPNLPIETRTIALDEADMACPECGDDLVEMAGQFDHSELIDVVEVQYKMVHIDAQKYRCPKGCCIEQPLAPQRAVPGGRYSVDFGVKVATDKYAHHLPLARQTRIMADHGLLVTRNTLWSQLRHMAAELEPTWAVIIQTILAQTVMGLDQTGWPNLHRKAAKKSQMWCLTAPGLVAHLIKDDKSLETFEQVTAGFQGVVVCDMMTTHIAAARAGPHITLAACWAHIRRKFAEAEADFPQARVALTMIRQIYDLERDITDREELRRTRDTETRKTVKTLQDWLVATRLPKTTALGNAIRHTLKHWGELTTFLNNPDVPLDNNPTERGIRGPVIGRRNHFGSKSKAGTKVAAIFYTLIECAKLSGVPPADYLRAALEAARLGDTLLPAEYLGSLHSDA